MPRYRLLIHGRNFRLKLDDRWQKAGFYTPRLADGPDSTLAAQVALEDFRHTKKYQDLVEVSLNGADDPSELLAEEIEEVHPDAAFNGGPPGLAFYGEEAPENAEPDAAPNGRPASPPGNSGTKGAPPSVN